jgi:regulator of sigma E protease
MMAVYCAVGMLVLFGLTIFVHELGHFLVARALGLVADVFSIGMGPAVWKRKIGGTTWQIGCLPIGGFVALPQLDPNSFLEGRGGRSLPPAAAWKKILVALAGAAGNIAFAFALGAVVWAVGKPMALSECNAVVGYVAADSAAEAAGIEEGDRIVSLDGAAVANWDGILNHTALSGSAEVLVEAEKPDGTRLSCVLPLEETELGVKVLPGLDGMSLCLVAEVYPNSSAEAAGLRAGDWIVEFGGKELYGRGHLSKLVDRAADEVTEIRFRRDGEMLAAAVKPQYDPALGRALIGIMFNTQADLDFAAKGHPTPWAQVKEHAGGIFRFLHALATPKTAGAAAGAVGGPVLIFVMFWTMLKLSWVMALWFTVFLNVNLAIVNLLPLPVLDGGQVVLGLVEWVRRKPLPAAVVNTLVNTFAVLLIAVLLVLVYRDTIRSILPSARRAFGPKAEDPVPVIFGEPGDSPASAP